MMILSMPIATDTKIIGTDTVTSAYSTVVMLSNFQSSVFREFRG